MFLSKHLRNPPQSFKYKFRDYHPCGKCGDHCDPNESLIINCGICQKYFHRSCVHLSKKKYLELTENKHTFICDRKCCNSILPLSQCDSIDFFDSIFGNNEYPCGKCTKDCVSQAACIQCSVCKVWNHFECSGISVFEFHHNDYYFCSKACELCLFPFSAVETNDLIKNEILHKSAKNIPKTNKPSEKAKPNEKIKTGARLPKPVKFDHFLEISCDYLDPNLIDDGFLKSNDTELTIFQNNIRSLNKNFDSVKEEIFKNCTKLPDILSFSETKLNENSLVPL